MKLQDLEFTDILKQENQVCGGDSNSNLDTDIDVAIGEDIDIDFGFLLDSANVSDSADVVISESLGWIETGVVHPPVGADPSTQYYLTVVGVDGEEVSGSLSAAIE